MQLPADADRALLLKTLREREEMASTGVGDGVALPHVRNPVLLSVPKPIVTLAFLARPVDWEALDKKPVSVVFSLVSPCVRSHLHMLSRLVFALKDAGFREALARRGSPDEILREVARVESMLLPSPAFPVLE
ncbi:PTS sugar transporter subunit IIA [bacterium]|nr:PTS sugar transporter subunit IIA [bacterium]